MEGKRTERVSTVRKEGMEDIHHEKRGHGGCPPGGNKARWMSTMRKEDIEGIYCVEGGH